MRTRLIILLSGLLCCLPPVSAAQETEANQTPSGQVQRKAILVTGASSGIGRVTAELLAQNGFFVYAGARKNKDIDSLNELDNVQAIRLDVTVPADIESAVRTIREAGRGLYGLINNAGVVVIAPLIEVPEEDLDFQMDVNVFGPYRVTKAFAPLIIESKGRISTTGSLSGTVTWGLGGPYTMSKFAVEAYTDTLAAEMARFGVQVSVVEPGNYKSRITTNMQERLAAKGYSAEGSLFEAQMNRVLGSPQDRAQFKDPDDVAAAFLHAMSDPEPQRRYLVVPNQGEAQITILSAITRLAQLNGNHEFSYDRDELVAMLDEALGTAESGDEDEVKPAPQATGAGFPASWVGTWEGTTDVFSTEGEPRSFTMKMEIAPTDDPQRYRWQTTSSGWAGTQVREYELLIRDSQLGKYAIDEKNGIVLEATFLDDTLYTWFEVEGVNILVRERLHDPGTADEAISFELISAPSEGVKSGEGDIVTSLMPSALQRVRLKRAE